MSEKTTREEAGPEGGEQVAETSSVALTMALDGARHDPHLREDIKAFLGRQQVLINAQIEHLHEQFVQLKLKRVSDWLKLAVQSITIAIGALFLLLVGGMVWQAAHSRVRVIDAFSVPPDLAQQGLTGQTVARQLQDHLADLGERSGSARSPASYENSWGRDVKVEIPETGVSLSELERFLRERFGHDEHISGEVFHSGPNLSVAVRTGEDSAVRVTGPAGNLDALVEQAAEQVFARTEPYRYATWLKQTGRMKEATAALQRLTNADSREDRIWAWVGLNTTTPDPEQSIAYLRQALRIDPGFSHIWFDVASSESNLGRYEAALADNRKAMSLQSSLEGRVTAPAAAWESAIERSETARLLGDFSGEAAALRSMEGRKGYSGFENIGPWQAPCALAALHDLGSADARLSADADDGAQITGTEYTGLGPSPRACIAAERSDWAAAAAQIQSAVAVAAVAPGFAATVSVDLKPTLALAWAHLGRIADARQLIGETPADCYPCVIARAQIAELAADRPAADRWFAEAVSQGPSLPAAWQAWGEARLARGDLVGAEAAFTSAAAKGPAWADPLKGLGDVAARQGRWREAVQAYDKALRRAPAWREAAAARKAAAARARAA